MEQAERKGESNRFAIEFSIEEIRDVQGGERAALCRWGCTIDFSPELAHSLAHLRTQIGERAKSVDE